MMSRTIQGGKMKNLLWMSLIFLVYSPMVQARVAANPTRPTFSDSANTTAQGHLELEIGAKFYHDDQLDTPFLLKLGLAKPLEFKLGGSGLRHDGRSGGAGFGFGNLDLITKFRFLSQRGTRPSMAILADITLPTASDDLHESTTDVAALLLMTGEFGPMSWTINTGVRFLGLNRDDSWLDIPAILALSAEIVGPLGVILEVADYIPLDEQDNRLHLLGAITWSFTRQLILDAAFVKGFDGAPDWEIHFGITSTLTRLW
jgi:hypothetical protein